MADRPAEICQLEKGKFIGGQKGFVDTFNWVAQSMANLQGGENCEVKWDLPDHPTIDVTAEGEGGGSSGGGGDGVNFIDNSAYENDTGKQTTFYLKSAYDSNVQFTCDGQNIYVGVYYK